MSRMHTRDMRCCINPQSTNMKILSYNISWSKQFKIDWLFRHKDASAFVVPECGNANNIVVPDGYHFYWVGNYDIKGLGVFVSNKHKHEIPSWANNNLNFAIPVILDDEYLLLAVWPTKVKDGANDSYIDILLEILEYYKEYISQYKTVIIGDYNIISSSKRTGKDNPYPIFDWMQEHGLKSAHHTFLNESYGKESLPTYFHQFKETCQFFIDYAFINADIADYKLYTWDETNRMSDHVPIMVEVK